MGIPAVVEVEQIMSTACEGGGVKLYISRKRGMRTVKQLTGNGDFLNLIISDPINNLDKSAQSIRMGDHEHIPPPPELLTDLGLPHGHRALHAIQQTFRHRYVGGRQIGVAPLSARPVLIARHHRGRPGSQAAPPFLHQLRAELLGRLGFAQTLERPVLEEERGI